ncbi:MAG: thioredoxin-disulfide reductase [Thermodesulfobacteriota bacterium]|nr:thioredoxin-disulfide reductase [Thermodesulfobacteriota bacterium]
MGSSNYDVIIVGGGPAGLTAGLYTCRSRLKTALIEKMVVGGQVATTEFVENYPGFKDGIMGAELIQHMEEQAKGFGLEILFGEIEGVDIGEDQLKFVKFGEKELLCKALIIASGTRPNELGIPGENALKGRGVSYCATCDGPFFKELDIAVIGGGDSAVEEAIFLTRYAKRVYIIHRRDKLRADKILQERAFNNEKIELVWDTVLDKITGSQTVEAIEVSNVKTKEVSKIEVGGVFMYVGLKPNTEFLKGLLSLDKRGFVITDDEMKTSVPGIFAAGDVRVKLLRQIATAVGDGAIAAFVAEKYLEL